MPNDFLEDLLERHRRRHRSKLAGSAGTIGFLAGAFLAGKVIIWLGKFQPGVTPNGTILNHWSGFLIGGAACGFLAASVARQVLAVLSED